MTSEEAAGSRSAERRDAEVFDLSSNEAKNFLLKHSGILAILWVSRAMERQELKQLLANLHLWGEGQTH